MSRQIFNVILGVEGSGRVMSSSVNKAVKRDEPVMFSCSVSYGDDDDIFELRRYNQYGFFEEVVII